MALRQYASWSGELVHLNVQISMCILPTNICMAFHRCVFWREPSNVSSWYKLWCNRGIHIYAPSASVNLDSLFVSMGAVGGTLETDWWLFGSCSFQVILGLSAVAWGKTWSHKLLFWLATVHMFESNSHKLRRMWGPYSPNLALVNDEEVGEMTTERKQHYILL